MVEQRKNILVEVQLALSIMSVIDTPDAKTAETAVLWNEKAAYTVEFIPDNYDTLTVIIELEYT